MRRTVPLAGRQSGQAMVEYVYVFPVLLLLVFGAIQFGFIYQAKTTLNYATFVATRQGALNNGSMSSILDGLTGGMAPLFNHDKSLDGLKAAYSFASTELSNPKIARIAIVNPTSAELDAYGVPIPLPAGLGSLPSFMGYNEIPNDNLMYRSTDIASPARMNIQDANLLKVRVTYCVRMVVPIINKLIYQFVSDAGTIAVSPGGGGASMLHAETASRLATCDIPDEYRLPITAEAVVRMQTTFRKPGKWVGP